MSFPRWFKSLSSSSSSSSSVNFPAASKTMRSSFSYQKDLDDEADESSEFDELSDLSSTNSSISELCSYRNEDEYCGRDGRISTAKADVMAKWEFLTKEERKKIENTGNDDGSAKTKSSFYSSVKANLILQEEYKKIARLEPEKPRDWQTRDYELRALKQKEWKIEAPEKLEKVARINGLFTEDDESKENKNANATTKKLCTSTFSPSLRRTTPIPLLLPSSSSVCNSLDCPSSSFSSSHHLCKFSQFVQQPKKAKMKTSYYSSNLYPSLFPSCPSTINSSYTSEFITSYSNRSANSSDASSITGPSETARRKISSDSNTSTDSSLLNVAAAATASFSNSSTATVRPFSRPISFFGLKGRRRRFSSFWSDNNNNYNDNNCCNQLKLLTNSSGGGSSSTSSKSTIDSSSKMRSNDSSKYNNKSNDRSSLFAQWFFSLKSSSKRINKLSSSFNKTSFFSTASSSPCAFLEFSASSSSSFLSPLPSTPFIHPSISITPRLSFRCLQSFSSLKYKMSNDSSTLCVCRQNEGEESSCGFPAVCHSYLHQSWWMHGMINAADRLQSRLKIYQQLRANCMAEVFLCVWLQKEVRKEAENLFMNAKTREEFEALPKDNQLDEDFGLITLGLEYDDITAYYYFRLRGALKGLKFRKFLLTPFCHPEHWFLAFDPSRIEDHKEV